MDSITQIVLGAAVGEAVLGKKVGNKAPLWGAVAGTIPDLDVLYGHFFLDPITSLIIHRGFSHSILFCILLSPILAWLVWKMYRKKDAGYKGWLSLFWWGLFTHPLLDCFTTWGTQLFWPWKFKVSLASIFVADPLYTVPFLLCVLIFLFIKRTSKWRRRINYIGIGLSSLYLIVTMFNKQAINKVFTEAVKRDKIEALKLKTSPAPLNNILWSASVETPDEYLYGYYSFFDDDQNIEWVRTSKNHQLIESIKDDPIVKKIERLTGGFYKVIPDGNNLLIKDARFVKSIGSDKISDHDFVFTYLLELNEDRSSVVNVDAVRAGASEEMDNMSELLSILWNRILGNSPNT